MSRSMSSPCLVDTNAASGVIRNVSAVQNVVRESEAIYVPVVTQDMYFDRVENLSILS